MALRIVLPILALFAIAACNTTAGLGEDISAAGTAIESEAQAAQ